MGSAVTDLLPSGTALPDDAWEPRHRIVVALLWVHALLLPVLALWMDRPVPLAAGASLLIAAFTVASSAPVLPRVARSALGAVGLMVCSSVVVVISGGQIEAYLHFFVMIPLVALYEHWLPFCLAIGYVLLQHGVVAAIAPTAIDDHSDAPQHPWRWALVHAGFFAAGCAGALADGRLAERSRETQSALATELGRRARHDALTGLPNRAALLEEGTAAMGDGGARGTPTAVLLIDLDRFKEVNDTLGHAWGDDLLRLVSERLRSGLHRDGMVTRLGGDEFAVLLPGCDSTGAVTVAQEMRAALGEGFSLAGLQLEVDSSIGVAVHVHRPTSVSGSWNTPPDTLMADLLRCADIAMYTAKSTNAGVHVYDPAEDARSRDLLTVLSDLRAALTTGELILHFQPKVRLGDGVVVGAEALVRWNHPRRGLQPGDFVPMVEQTALITPMTAVVLELAIRQARELLDRGHRLQIAVNVSTRSLRDSSFVHLVLSTLARHDLPGELLRLEITETSLMTDPASAMDVLQQLAARGIGLSIDDFGTGYSSMSYLRQLPVDELKVDRSFVSMLTAQGLLPSARTPADFRGPSTRWPLGDDAVLVRSALELGHNLGMSVVAEGVESLRALELLVELGCDDAQGFHIARPMPGTALVALLDAPAPAAARASQRTGLAAVTPP